MPKEMLFPRFLRLVWRASISVLRCSVREAEKARHETPPPFCTLGLSTRWISTVSFFSGPDDVLDATVSSVLLERDVTASSSLSLSSRYLVPAKGEATV